MSDERIVQALLLLAGLLLGLEMGIAMMRRKL